eukprot:2079805-Alexandrium_andersonii.AAC.1
MDATTCSQEIPTCTQCDYGYSVPARGLHGTRLAAAPGEIAGGVVLCVLVPLARQAMCPLRIAEQPHPLLRFCSEHAKP